MPTSRAAGCKSGHGPMLSWPSAEGSIQMKTPEDAHCQDLRPLSYGIVGHTQRWLGDGTTVLQPCTLIHAGVRAAKQTQCVAVPIVEPMASPRVLRCPSERRRVALGFECGWIWCDLGAAMAAQAAARSKPKRRQ